MQSEILDSNTPEFSTFTYEGMCEEGSLTFFIAVGTFVFIFFFRNMLYRKTEEYNRMEGENVDDNDDPFPTDPTDDQKTVHFINRYFVKPFAYNTLETFIAVLFFFWFSMTIPIAFTRFYKDQWEQELITQQGPLNVITNLMNCTGLDFNVITYTGRIHDKDSFQDPDQIERDEELDPVFAYHLLAGILWLSAGFLQIYFARSGWSTNKTLNHEYHRKFGKVVAIPSLLFHIFCTCRIIWRNPVEQTWAIRFQYIFTVADSIILAILGIKAIRDSRKPENANDQAMLRSTHKLRMAFCYFESIFGSGSIRLTAWVLWIVAKFFPPFWQNRIDRGTCQHGALERGQSLGSAEDCWIPVFFNMALTEMLILWLEFVFLNVPNQEFQITDQDRKIFKFKIHALTIISIPLFISFIFPSLDGLGYCLTFVYGVLLRMHSFWLWIGTPLDLRKNQTFLVKVKNFIHSLCKKLVRWTDDNDHNKQD